MKEDISELPLSATTRESGQKQQEKIYGHIKTQDIEGECTILNIQYLQKNTSKILLSVLLTLFSFGLYGILLFWSLKLRKISFYKIVDKISETTHICVTNFDNQ